jgi:HPt (histidine-containing phosphotransfer) domain-containing protein
VAALALPGAPIAAEPAPLPANGLVPAAHLAIEHLTETLGGDAVVGIVASFFDGLPRQLARMADLAGDTDPLLREAHALAVSAATIGLDELGAAASELEEDLKWRRLGAIPARLDRIDRLARTGLERLSAYLDTRAA